MEHLGLLGAVEDSAKPGRTLQSRAAGQFYTPELIGRQLAAAVREKAPSVPEVRVIDPFCGDGRLIEWLIEETATDFPRGWNISLWDVDPEAVRRARERVSVAANRRGISVVFDCRAGDTFKVAPRLARSFDIAITNPPWERLKPDRRELAALGEEEREQYVRSLRDFDAFLGGAFPLSRPTRRFAGWGTNLARVGTEVACTLVKPGGVCGIVSPSSLFADASSAPLRRWLLTSFELIELAFFPAETRLFEAMDVPCLTMVARARPSTAVEPFITVFDRDRKMSERSRAHLAWASLENNEYVIPVALGSEGIELLASLDGLTRFRDLEHKAPDGLWAGREVDETRRERFVSAEGTRPFLKGRHVQRLMKPEEPPEFVRDELAPASARFPRLVWRDVSRPSQRRRVQATVIPSGWVCGNSLGVAHFRDGNLPHLLWLLGVMSSLVFEYQLRAILSTGHVSLTSVRQVCIPALGTRLDRIAEASLAVIENKLPVSQLEVDVARAYDLDHSTWTRLVGHFPGISDEERDGLISEWG